MSRALADFAHISVREKSGQKIVKQLTGRDAFWALDPTLLFTVDRFHPFEIDDCVPDSPYLLCYFLGGRPENWQRARQIADALHLKLAVIPFLKSDIKQGDLVFPEAGPGEFLGLFRHAAYVCTDSFHGTVFSLHYQRPFTVFERNIDASAKMSTRMESLLSLAGVPERFIKNDELSIEQCLQPIDFEACTRNIAVEREKSMAFLASALEQACAHLTSPRIDI